MYTLASDLQNGTQFPQKNRDEFRRVVEGLPAALMTHWKHDFSIGTLNRDFERLKQMPPHRALMEEAQMRERLSVIFVEDIKVQFFSTLSLPTVQRFRRQGEDEHPYLPQDEDASGFNKKYKSIKVRWGDHVRVQEEGKQPPANAAQAVIGGDNYSTDYGRLVALMSFKMETDSSEIGIKDWMDGRQLAVVQYYSQTDSQDNQIPIPAYLTSIRCKYMELQEFFNICNITDIVDQAVIINDSRWLKEPANAAQEDDVEAEGVVPQPKIKRARGVPKAKPKQRAARGKAKAQPKPKPRGILVSSLMR